MCLIMLAWQQHEDVPLLIAANRDEAFDRPSADLDWWTDAPDIAAGRDRVAGGTWLALHRNGRFGVVTNFREPDPAPSTRSRGELITRWLTEQPPAEAFAARLAEDAHAYAGFNLLYGDRSSLHYFSNRDPHSGPLAPGTYALSNALLDTPWPKVTAARRHAEDAIAAGTLDPEHYFAFLVDATPAPDDALPEEPGSLARRRVLSAPFIVGDRYGTRCSTVVSRERDGAVRMTERHYAPGGTRLHDRTVSFSLQP